jgi:hypothetical protein
MQPHVQWVPGAVYARIKRQWHEANRSPPTSAEVKNEWNYTSTPPYVRVRQCTETLPLNMSTIANTGKIETVYLSSTTN